MMEAIAEFAQANWPITGFTGSESESARICKADLHEAWVRGCADAVFGRRVNVYRTEAKRDAWQQGHQTGRILGRVG